MSSGHKSRKNRTKIEVSFTMMGLSKSGRILRMLMISGHEKSIRDRF